MYVHMYCYHTRVVQDVLYDVLDLVKCQVVLRSLACVSMYPHSWSIHKVAFLDVLEPLQADVMEEQEGTLTHSLAMVVKLTVCYFPQFRTGGVVALQCGRLVAVSHNLSHHKQV